MIVIITIIESSHMTTYPIHKIFKNKFSVVLTCKLLHHEFNSEAQIMPQIDTRISLKNVKIVQ